MYNMTYQKGFTNTMEDTMNCREFESNIQSFITGEFDERKYDSFMEHYNNCSECREELEILYLVHNTINSDLSDEFSFNLRDRLKIHMKNMEDMVYRHYKYNFLKNFVIILAETVLSGAGITFILRLLNIIS